MRIDINGHETFISTGGKGDDFTPDANKPPLLFIHGSGQSHLSWLLQARFFANRGHKVLAPDLPGHGLSKGDAPQTIEAAADWCAALLDEMKTDRAIVIGHSQGGLVALEFARRHTDKTIGLAIVASAAAIMVADGLIEMAKSDETAAHKAMVTWSLGTIGARHDHTVPGMSHAGFGRKVMAGNPGGALLTDLMACRSYTDGLEAASAITCPAICVLAGHDRMVPKRMGLELGDAIPGCRITVIEKAGHFVQSEHPDAANAALREFFDGDAK